MASGRDFFFGIERVFEHYHFDNIEAVVLPPEPRSILLCMDAGRIPFDNLRPLAAKLLQAGGVYFCCHGFAAKQIHDAIDWVRAERELWAEQLGLEEMEDSGRVIMTTWHDDEPIENVVEFWCRFAYPPSQWGPVRNWTSVVINNPMLHFTVEHIVETRELSDLEMGRAPMREDL